MKDAIEMKNDGKDADRFRALLKKVVSVPRKNIKDRDYNTVTVQHIIALRGRGGSRFRLTGWFSFLILPVKPLLWFALSFKHRRRRSEQTAATLR